MRVALWRRAAAGSSEYDQINTLSCRELAHYVAGLTVKLPRLNSRRDLTRQLLRLRERMRTPFELCLGESALTIGRLPVTTGPARCQLEPRPRPEAANEYEKELGLSKRDLAFQRMEQPFSVESVDEHEYAQRVQPLLWHGSAQRKLAATSTAAAISVSGATTAPSLRKSHAET